MTKPNWINHKINPHRYDGPILRREYKYKYRIQDEKGGIRTIESNREQQEIENDNPKSKVTKL